MQITFQKRILILSALLFFVTCFVFLFLYNGTLNSKAKYQQAKKELHDKETEQRSAQFVINSAKSLGTADTLLDSHFIKSSDVVPFLDNIESLAQKSQILSEITSVDIAKDNRLLSVDLKVDGSFENIYKFVLLLENSPYIIRFTSGDVRKADNSKTGWTGKFKINLLSFANK